MSARETHPRGRPRRLGGRGADPGAIAAEARRAAAAPERSARALPPGPGRGLRRRAVGPGGRQPRSTASRASPSCPRPCGAISPSTASGDVALQPAAELRGLDWAAFEAHATLAADEAVGVGLARWGIAETGSLVFHSGPDTPILLAFLPLHHIVAVSAGTILALSRGLAAPRGGRRRATPS